MFFVVDKWSTLFVKGGYVYPIFESRWLYYHILSGIEMNKKNKFPFFIVVSLLAILFIVFLMHLGSDIAVLHPKGWVGLKQRDLILKTSFIMLLIVIPVVVLTIYFGWKYREGKQAKHEPEWAHNYLLESIWWGVPLIVIIVFSVWTWTSTYELDPYKPLKEDAKPLTIQVIALDWKWLFIYPEQQIATVNFIQFPENRPLNFEITADAPMNSFWIPALGGQIYAMPGMRTRLHLIANQEGNYRGLSANLSGTGFAGMTFTAKASTEAEFEDWVSSVQRSSRFLDSAEYDQLVKPSSYNEAAYYVLQDSGLFDRIVMKYMPMDTK
jgi:cytochrome o ubiquinol oxidase subunit 2